MIRRPAQRGFTLLELLVVVAIIAIASAGVTLALRDATANGLEREALRLAALLESQRAQSRASGVPVRWRGTETGFAFDVLRTESQPGAWLTADTVASGAAIILGPEPIIGPQTITLRSRSRPQQQLQLVTDGVRPFRVQDAAPQVQTP